MLVAFKQFTPFVLPPRNRLFLHVTCTVRRNNQRQRISRNRLNTKAAAQSRRTRSTSQVARRARTVPREEQNVYSPPETWHEPTYAGQADYQIVVESAGDGYEHVVTPAEVRKRLAELPSEMLKPLDVVQLSGMTRKKALYPLYGMQWGSTLYLYPIEEGLVEYFPRKPEPAFLYEARMYGGRWVQSGEEWECHWTPKSIRNYYLNNILIHELGHLLDTRNTSYVDRERYAEWFAIEYGYKPAQRKKLASKAAKKIVRRRHHSA